MNELISQFITEWGTFGAVLLGIGYLIYDNWKTNKTRKSNKDETVSIVKSLDGKLDNLNDRIDIIDTKVDDFKAQVNTRFKLMDDKIVELPNAQLSKMESDNANKKQVHLKQLDDLMKLGPKLHRIIQSTNNSVGSDHIFVGSFHNGNSNLTGIPYYKFDIIAERFSPIKVAYDTEFAHMYKDADILRFDTLPMLLEQHGTVHFEVPEEGEVGLAEFDDIIWRRMRGRGIRQIALCLTRDSKGTPSGFVGVVKYNMDELKLEYLEQCARELEDIYKEAELKESK